MANDSDLNFLRIFLFIYSCLVKRQFFFCFLCRRALPDFDQAAYIHDTDAVRHVAHNGMAMGDQQIGEPELLLQIGHRVYNPGLD
jgi:hypothetical protein